MTVTGERRPARLPGGVRAGARHGTPRILVDGRVMQDRYHGIGRYTFELLSELSRRHVDLTILHSPDQGRLDTGELMARPTVRAVASSVPVASVRSQWLLFRAMLAFRPDVVFIPYHLSTPLLHGRVPVVSVIHDCIFEREAAVHGRSAFSVAYATATRLAIRSAAALATPSEASRQDIRRFYGVDLPAAAILPHGVSRRYFSAASRPRPAGIDLPGRYILHVGVQRPHKNQRVLVEALAALRSDLPDLGLVLVGQQDPRFPDETGKLVTALGVSDRVWRYTDLDDETLLDLYANAAVFAYPSLVEGFGMPVLEAMAAGLAVVASDAEAVQEVAGGGALIVPARAPARDWAQALARVLSDPQFGRDLRERGRAVAATHTWSQSAERTLAMLASTAGGDTFAVGPAGGDRAASDRAGGDRAASDRAGVGAGGVRGGGITGGDQKGW
jgi:glycosyltransferase involved in cell wall biosynthesis